MSNFVRDLQDPPPMKSDKTGTPGTEDPNKWWAASDANVQRQIDIDLRGEIVKGQLRGLEPQGSAPPYDSGAVREYVDAAGKVHTLFQDGTDKVLMSKDGPGPNQKREGVLNVQDFGATVYRNGDSVTVGSSDAIQAALDSISVEPVNGVGQAVRIPAGFYRLDKPLFLEKNNVRLLGDGREATFIQNYGDFGGPLIQLQCPQAAQNFIATEAGPFASTTAMTVTRAPCNWITWDDHPMADLNGLAAFTVRGWVKFRTCTGNDWVLGARGRLTSQDAIQQSGLNIQLVSFGAPAGQARVQANLTTTAGVFQIDSMSTSVFYSPGWHHVAVCFDGSHMALYVDGTRVGSDLSCTGTVLRKHYHTMAMGMCNDEYPASNSLNLFDGALHSVELRNDRVYTGASFTPPTSSHTETDGKTLILWNFDRSLRNNVVARGALHEVGGIHDMYCPVRSGAGSDIIPDIATLQTTFHAVEGLNIVNLFGNAIYCRAILDSQFRNLHLKAYKGIEVYLNSYQLLFSGIHIDDPGGANTGPIGIALSNQVGICRFESVWVTGYKTCLGWSGGLGARIDQLYYQPSSSMVVPFIFGMQSPNSVILADYIQIDGEGSWPNFEAGVVIRGANAGVGASFRSCYWEFGGPHVNDAPIILLDQVNSVILENNNFTAISPTTNVIKFATTPSAGEDIQLNNCRQLFSSNPWVAPADAYRLQRGERGINAGKLPFEPTGDGSTDDSAALQASLDAAAALPLGGRWFLPPSRLNSRYVVGKPLTFSGSNTVLEGVGPGSQLIGGGFFGPLLVMGGGAGGIPTQAKLCSTGAGLAMTLDRTAAHYLCLTDCETVNLNGKATGTVEFLLKVASDPVSGNEGVLHCQGARDTGMAASAFGGEQLDHTFTFRLEKATDFSGPVGSSAIICGLNVAGTFVVIHTGFLGTPFFINDSVSHECMVSYDGAHVFLLVDGVVISSVAATGNLKQYVHNEWTIGPAVASFPESVQQVGMVSGAIDRIRISDSCRHAANYTPTTAKFTWDTSTLFLHNFDNEQGQFSVALARQVGGTGAQAAWLLARQPAVQGPHGSNTLKNLNFQHFGNAQPVQFYKHTNWLIQNCVFGVPVKFLDNCFEGAMSSCLVSTNARAALSFNTACGVTMVRDTNIIGGLYQAVANGGGVNFDHVYFAPNANTIACMFLKSTAASLQEDSTCTLKDVFFDEEATTAGVYEAGCIVSTMNSVAVVGGAFDLTSVSAIPAFKIDGGRKVSFDGSAFAMFSDAQQITVLHTSVKPLERIGFTDCTRYKLHPTAPWCDTAGYFSVDGHVGGQFTVSDTATSPSAVTIGPAEPNDYHVQITSVAKSGSPAAGSNLIETVTKTTTSFTPVLTAAPGAGTSRTFDWSLARST